MTIHRESTAGLLLIAIGFGLSAVLLAQTPSSPQTAPAAAALPIVSEPSGHTTTLVFFNRPIVVLRARVLGREPADRAAAALHVLDDVERLGVTGPVQHRAFEGGSLISVGLRGVLVVTPADIDQVSGETVDSVAAQAAERLQPALTAAVASRSMRVFLPAAALALGGLIAGLLLLVAIGRAHRALTAGLMAVAEDQFEKSGLGDRVSLRASRLLDVQRGCVTSIAVAADLLVIYATVSFMLHRFPYTQPWGESMRGFFLTTAEQTGLAAAGALPGLFMAAVILLIAGVLTRLIGLWFNAIINGLLTTRYVHVETAHQTRRLIVAGLWVFALIVAYPYLPGSQTDAFKGVTVFLGVVFSLGSTGLVNQLMGGLVVTYSRALRLGDFVKLGDIEGTVTHLGALSIKLKTLRREEVTIPNAVVIAQTMTDYSRNGDAEGIFTPTSVTIGYDAPWRQVHALLELAAERTPGLRREPRPVVLQTALEDAYVRYTLLVSLERQDSRPQTLDALHAHIQDLFNEHGIQIMSPNYVFDPARPKVVARENWFAAPAQADRHAERGTSDMSEV